EIIDNEVIENIKSTQNKDQEVPDDVVGFSDEEIKAMLKSIYFHVDSEYFSTKIGDLLARRLSFDGTQMDGHVDNQLKGGATAILALIVGRRLYIANCGNSIAILIKEIGNELSLFPIYQLHENHEVGEMERIRKLGLPDPRVVKNPTRCFGDYFRKGGYKENQLLKEATSEPIIVEPTVIGGVNMDDAFRFLLFVSPTVVRAIHIIKPSANVNETLAEWIVAEIKNNRTIESVAQKVLDNICHQYDGVLKTKIASSQKSITRDSMSMLFIPLCSNMVEKLDPENEVREQQILTQTNGDSNNCVQPYVDFSEFETSELRDTVLAKIESLKQYYKDKKTMHIITEE
uniref:PPM-type phosphatase domain-containing protein n=1 Tax=Acrobeloides nanus TaxID=290746 RepID=A0A914D0X8_9BILA